MGLSQVHQALANASLIFSLIIAVYGFWRYFRRQGVDANFWGVLAAGELLFLVQIGFGVVLLLSGLRPARTAVHLLYGVLLGMTLPAIYLFTRAADTRSEALMYAAAGLFLAGIALRGMTTALTVLPGG